MDLSLAAFFGFAGVLVRLRNSRPKARDRVQTRARTGGQRRGQEAAALDAAGAGLGSLGLLAFAISFTFLSRENVLEALFIASIAWLTVSMSAWWLKRKVHVSHRQ